MVGKIGVMTGLLFLFLGNAVGKPIEFQISIPLVEVSDRLFDYTIKKTVRVYSPDSNPIVELINLEARNEYHFYHPTWKEFISFQ
jgi:hypothetical protein